MADKSAEPILTAVFVDYDNIYLSLKRRSEDAAKRFAKDAASWIKDIESGRLMTATNSPSSERPRRIVLNRCYGNPVPRRNAQDNSTDMNSFPFVRHHFLRAGFEVIDCPPLTAQLKNSSDIRMVMDVRDFLNHDTRFEEFVILSGDADFTPVLHRLRAHARRTVIFANDYTAAPYTAICDAEVKESQLLSVLLEGKIGQQADQPAIAAPISTATLTPIATMPAIAETPSLETLRLEILSAVTNAVRQAGGPVPLEALAERTTRSLGHDRTVGSGWAGAGSFLELLRGGFPDDLRLTDQPPYLAFEAKRGIAHMQAATASPRAIEQQDRTEPALPISTPDLARIALRPPVNAAAAVQPQNALQPAPQAPRGGPQYQRHDASAMQPQPGLAPRQTRPIQPPTSHQPTSHQPTSHQPTSHQLAAQPVQSAPQPAPRQPDMATAIQQSIARIHDACQAPPLSPPEYRALFEIMAKEISESGLQGDQTMSNINVRAQEVGISLSRDDVRFVMEVVSQSDPWFEQGASTELFAGRFRNFVVARCRSQGLSLSSDELDLIEAWFAGTGQSMAPQNIRVPARSAEVAPATGRQQAAGSQGSTWGDQPVRAQQSARADEEEEFPKILRTRLRG